MRRAKIGDLYCMKVPNGYKIYQFAYKHPNGCSYIRVFPHLYDKIPNDLKEIAESEHSYIIGFAAGKAYRNNLAEFLGNFAVPEEYPFPRYSLVGGMGAAMCILDNSTDRWLTEFVGGYAELPEEFRTVKALSCSVTPDWLLYLFDTDFDLSDWNKFLPRNQIDKYHEIYEKMIEGAKIQ